MFNSVFVCLFIWFLQLTMNFVSFLTWQSVVEVNSSSSKSCFVNNAILMLILGSCIRFRPTSENKSCTHNNSKFKFQRRRALSRILGFDNE